MTPSPEFFGLSSYEASAINLLTRVDELLMARSIPQKKGHSGNRSQELRLSEEETAAVAQVFTSQVLDAPEEIRLWLSADYPTGAPRQRLSCQEVLFISTEHEDVKTDYNIWIEPKSELIVTFRKDSARSGPLPNPYAVGPFSCEATYYEALSHNAIVAAHEQTALFELVDLLIARTPRDE